MKAIISVLLLSLFSSLAYADIRPEHSGAWYNPDQSGHGLSIQVLDDERTIAFWFTYTPDGYPIFLVINGVNDGHTVTGPAYHYEGMIWRQFDPATLNSEAWGEISIEFLGCNSAVLSWSSDLEDYGDGQVELERLTHLYGLGCDEVAAELTGEWQADFAEDYHASFLDMPYTVTVDADGNFEFYDELECLWEGHIHVISMEWGDLTARFGSPSCPSPVPMRFATGRYYSGGASFCNSSGSCIEFDQYLTLHSEDDQGQIINLYFLR